jgi:ribonuclease HI
MPNLFNTTAPEPKKKTNLLIFTDGGARGNPGPAGIGAVFYEQASTAKKDIASPKIKPKKIAEIKKYIGESTNNFAEYTALLTALQRAAEMHYENVQCFLDSELVVRQLNGQYKVREQSLKPLAEKVLKLTNNFKKITFNHVPRDKNAVADKLVNEAIDQRLNL